MLKIPRIFYGWRIVAAGVTVNIVASSVFIYGFGAFFVPWREAFGWSRAQIAGVQSLARLEGGVVGPVSGWLVDRYGPRRMMLVGLSLMGLGFLVMSRVNSLLMLYLVFLGMLSLGSGLGGFRPVQVAVANWFMRRRGRVMGMLAAGYAGGGSLVFLFAMLIDRYGWRTGAVVAGLLIWIICLPLALVVRHKPEDMGLHPDGENSPRTPPVAGVPGIQGGADGLARGTSRQDAPRRPSGFWGLPAFMQRDPRPELDLTPWQALRTPAFWLLAVTTTVWGMTPVVHTIHFVPFVVEEIGLKYVAAAGALSFFAFVSMFGRLGFGFVADYVNIRLLAALLIAFEGVGIFLVSQAHGLNQLLVSTVVFAIAHGGALVMWPTLQGYLFGRRAFGTIGGLSAPLHIPVTVAAPMVAGYMADTIPHGYRLAFGIIAVTLVVTSVCVLMMRRPREPLPVDRAPALLRMLRAGFRAPSGSRT